jgi:hypothetical protein
LRQVCRTLTQPVNWFRAKFMGGYTVTNGKVRVRPVGLVLLNAPGYWNRRGDLALDVVRAKTRTFTLAVNGGMKLSG